VIYECTLDGKPLPGCAVHNNAEVEAVLEEVELAIRAAAINDPDMRTRYTLHLMDCLNILDRVRNEHREQAREKAIIYWGER
jgi:hypothetical protein